MQDIIQMCSDKKKNQNRLIKAKQLNLTAVLLILIRVRQGKITQINSKRPRSPSKKHQFEIDTLQASISYSGTGQRPTGFLNKHRWENANLKSMTIFFHKEILFLLLPNKCTFNETQEISVIVTDGPHNTVIQNNFS